MDHDPPLLSHSRIRVHVEGQVPAHLDLVIEDLRAVSTPLQLHRCDADAGCAQRGIYLSDVCAGDAWRTKGEVLGPGTPGAVAFKGLSYLVCRPQVPCICH